MKKLIIAFDLHGTLLDASWGISQSNMTTILELIDTMSDIADFYLVTGNDFSFVCDYVPASFLEKIDGLILESGSIIHNFKSSTFLIDKKTTENIVELTDYFKNKKYSFVKHFGNRQCTVSLFTTDKTGGQPPESYIEIVNNDLKQHPFSDMFYLTHSNVAIDILPVNTTKYDAIRKVATEKSLEICSFVDSYNDKEIARFSTYTFLPKNVSLDLMKYLNSHNKLIFKCNKFHLVKNLVYISEKSYTEAVIDGLQFLAVGNSFIHS